VGIAACGKYVPWQGSLDDLLGKNLCTVGLQPDFLLNFFIELLFCID
jgi:hypothetical protein